MNIQEIFNLVIDRGYYGTSRTDAAMCNSLRNAWHWGVISSEEYQFAEEQIKKYLQPTHCVYLEDALEKSGLPSTIQARTAIYRDWANRPALTTN